MGKNLKKEVEFLRSKLAETSVKCKENERALQQLKESSEIIIDRITKQKETLENQLEELSKNTMELPSVEMKSDGSIDSVLNKLKCKIINADSMRERTNKVLYGSIISEIMTSIIETSDNGGYSVVLQRGIKEKSDDCLYSLYDAYVVDYFVNLDYEFIWLIDDYYEEDSHKVADSYKLAISWK